MRAERGVYVDEMSFDGYVQFTVIGGDGVLLRREVIRRSKVHPSTEDELWSWLTVNDRPNRDTPPTGNLRIA